MTIEAGQKCPHGRATLSLQPPSLVKGEIAWRYGNGEDPFFSCPAVGADRVVIGGRDWSIHCVSRADGKEIWKFPTKGEVNSSPEICGERVLAGSDDGRLYLLGLANGGEIWSYDLGGAVGGGPAVARGRAYAATADGAVYAFGERKQ